MDARFRLEEVYKIIGIGLVLVGTVTRGSISVGMVGLHKGIAFPVRTIEMQHQEVAIAQEGDKIGMSVHGIDAAEIEDAKGRELEFTDGPAPTADEPARGIERKPKKGFFARLFSR